MREGTAYKVSRTQFLLIDSVGLTSMRVKLKELFNEIDTDYIISKQEADSAYLSAVEILSSHDVQFTAERLSKVLSIGILTNLTREGELRTLYLDLNSLPELQLHSSHDAMRLYHFGTLFKVL